MKCEACGAEITENTKFCGNCGAVTNQQQSAGAETVQAGSIPEQTPVVPEKKKKTGIKIAAAVAVVIVIIIAVAVLSGGSGSTSYLAVSESMFVFQDGDIVTIEPFGKSRIEIDGRLINISYSADRKKAAVLIDEDQDYGSSGENSLYLITDKATLISENVYDMRMALSGDAIVYTEDYDSGDRLAELCLWSGGKVSSITKDYSTRNGYVISPDGKTVGYTQYDDEVEGFYYDGKSTSLGENVVPVAITNGAKQVYYTKNESFYVQKGADGDSKNKLGEGVYGYYFNSDLTQIVYDYNSKSYISRDGKERQALSSRVSSFLVPRYVVNYSNVLGVSGFGGAFYRNDSDAIVYIDSNLETNVVVRNVESAQLADDGKTIMYTRNGSIYKINGTKVSAAPEELVDEDIRGFLATPDGGGVYYVTRDDEMYYQKGTGKAVLIDGDLVGNRGYSESWTIFGGDKLFYVSDGELYTSTGGKGKVVTAVSGDIEYVYSDTANLFVYAADGYEEIVYRSADGSKFESYEIGY